MAKYFRCKLDEETIRKIKVLRAAMNVRTPAIITMAVDRFYERKLPGAVVEAKDEV